MKDVMDPPFPEVPSDINIEGLRAHLGEDAGAVLVRTPGDDTLDILTRSDLIAALATSDALRSGSNL